MQTDETAFRGKYMCICTHTLYTATTKEKGIMDLKLIKGVVHKRAWRKAREGGNNLQKIKILASNIKKCSSGMCKSSLDTSLILSSY